MCITTFSVLNSDQWDAKQGRSRTLLDLPLLHYFCHCSDHDEGMYPPSCQNTISAIMFHIPISRLRITAKPALVGGQSSRAAIGLVLVRSLYGSAYASRCLRLRSLVPDLVVVGAGIEFESAAER